LQLQGEDHRNRPAAAAEIENPTVRQALAPAGRQDLLDQKLRFRPRDQDRRVDDEGQRPEFPFTKDIGDRFPPLPPLEIAKEDLQRLLRHLHVRCQIEPGPALVQTGPEQQLAIEIAAARYPASLSSLAAVRRRSITRMVSCHGLPGTDEQAELLLDGLQPFGLVVGDQG